MTLEEHLRAAMRNRAAVPPLCQMLVASDIIVLGRSVGDSATRSEGQLDVLHFLSGRDQVTPVFTDMYYVDIAVAEDPTCGTFQPITVHGTYLLEKVGDEVLVLVNPWSDVEVELHSRDVRVAIMTSTHPS